MIKRVLCAAVAAMTMAGTASAQEDYLGEILMVGFNFCPRGTLPAEGQLLAISQYTALFSLYGTQYGGDGRTTFALPDLRGRTAVGAGQGQGLSPHPIGSRGGAEQTSLTVNQLPAHNHGVAATLNGVGTPASSPNPAGNLPAVSTTAPIYGTGATVPMSPQAATVTQNTVGGSQPIPTRSPFLAIRYCVVEQGIYPSRN